MVPLPRIRIVQGNFIVLLSSIGFANMYNWYTEHMFSPVGADIGAVPKGLFLIIILYFPTNGMVHYITEGK
jgi:hypothetical protein